MIIPIAEFCGQNKSSNKITTISVERVDDYGQIRYYYLTENGNRSTPYRSIRQAIDDIAGIYGTWCGFKILVEVE